MPITSYNLGTAATATGLARSTILKSIRKGRISASRDELGGWIIQAAELHRVYPTVAQRNAAKTPDNDLWNDKIELAELRARLTDARDEIEFLRRAHTELTAERAKLTALLLPPPPPTRLLWWRRLRVQ